MDALTHIAARPLTDREISKIISGLLSGLLQWCDVDQIMSALDHFHRHRDNYEKYFTATKFVAGLGKTHATGERPSPDENADH